MAAILRLLSPVDKPVNNETVRELEELLEQAKQGNLTGVAYIATHAGANFSLNATGRARYVPAYSLGALKALESLLFTLMS